MQYEEYRSEHVQHEQLHQQKLHVQIPSVLTALATLSLSLAVFGPNGRERGAGDRVLYFVVFYCINFYFILCKKVVYQGSV